MSSLGPAQRKDLSDAQIKTDEQGEAKAQTDPAQTPAQPW
jgi:hypothetical protein